MNDSERKHHVKVGDDAVIAEIRVSLHANGALSIQGPQDAAWTLAALENAADAVRARVRREEDRTRIVVPDRDVDIPASRLVTGLPGNGVAG